MSGPPREETWTVLLLRGGGGRVFEWTGRRRLAAAVAGAALLAVAAAGAGVGLAWAERREARRVTELKEQVRQLRRERARVGRLAARLDSIEREYRQIRRVMAAAGGQSEGDVALPAVPEEEASEPASAGGEGRASARGGWAWPLSQKGFVTRTHREGESEGSGEHRGLDIAVPVGSYVRAARSGEVEAAGDDSVFGLFVRLRHPEGYTSLYGHNRWLFVSPGDTVVQGEVIALSGNSGRSTAPHLHFEVTRGESSLDPERLLGAEVPGAPGPGMQRRGGGS